MKKSRILFCELNETCYRISVKKEILKRRLTDFFSHDKIALHHSTQILPVIVKSHVSPVMRKLEGVDETLQQNKAFNLELASPRISGILIKSGEIFSFWKLIGPTERRQGYKKGLVIKKRNLLTSDYGGGLCQLANLIHYMVLNSPLTVTELHHHTDALFPDSKRQVPFGTGTSVMYNYIDYRFKNTTDQDIQILTWIKDGYLYGELRTTKEFPVRYRLSEESCGFIKEGEKFFRVSKVYKSAFDRISGNLLSKELILDNHSEVLYDYNLIPEDQILHG